MGFKVLPPGLAQRLIQGEDDTLTPLAAERTHEIKSRPCERCGGNMHPMFHPTASYSEHDPLPRTIGRCVDCGFTLDPRTGFVLDNGNPTKIEDPFRLNVEPD